MKVYMLPIAFYSGPISILLIAISFVPPSSANKFFTVFYSSLGVSGTICIIIALFFLLLTKRTAKITPNISKTPPPPAAAIIMMSY